MNPADTPIIVITRPQPQADEWVQRLHAQGWKACALPMMEIRHTTKSAFDGADWSRMRSAHALMFVSVNALEGWWSLLSEEQRQQVLQAWSQQPSAVAPRVWVTGLATAQAALRLGVPAEWIDRPLPDESEDSESLWRVVQPQVQPGGQVWIMRGAEAQGSKHMGSGHGRSWLGDVLTEQGATVQYLATYERDEPNWSESEQKIWRQLCESTWPATRLVWVFTSAQLLKETVKRMDTTSAMTPRVRQGKVCVTHERMVPLARSAGWTDINCIGSGVVSLMRFLEQHFGAPHQPPLESSI